MQVRNLLIAAGASLAALTGIAAAPTAASAQEYRPIYRTYEPAHYGYGYERERFEHRRFEERRLWELRREEARRRAEWRFHHRYEERRWY